MNVTQRQGNQRYAVEDWIYVYRFEDIKRYQIRKLEAKWIGPRLLQAQVLENVWIVKLVSLKLMKAHVDPMQPYL